MDNKSEDPKYLYMLPISNSFMIDELQKEQRKKTEMEEMIKFTGYGRKNNIDFGDYVKYPYCNELHIYKVVGSYNSNCYQDIPDSHKAEEVMHDEVVPVLNIIHCGLDETKVITVKESDCIKMETDNIQAKTNVK